MGEVTESGTIIIDTPGGLEHFKMCQVIARLKLELSGITFRQPTLKAARHYYGITARTKRAGLEQMLVLYKETWGREYGREQ